MISKVEKDSVFMGYISSEFIMESLLIYFGYGPNINYILKDCTSYICI